MVATVGSAKSYPCLRCQSILLATITQNYILIKQMSRNYVYKKPREKRGSYKIKSGLLAIVAAAEMRDLFESLPETWKRFIIFRCGLEGPSLTHAEIGEKLSFTQQRASQMEGQIIKRIKERSLEIGMRDALKGLL
jgi:DNA-directed RNA polymerase specialized sigma subunit